MYTCYKHWKAGLKKANYGIVSSNAIREQVGSME